MDDLRRQTRDGYDVADLNDLPSISSTLDREARPDESYAQGFVIATRR